MVAVVGVSASSQANLLAEIDALGTNLLTVTPGQTFLGNNEVLPDTSVPMIGHMHNVDSDAAIYQISSAIVYRTPFVPVAGDRRDRRRRRRRQPAPGGRHVDGLRALPRRRRPTATRRWCSARRRPASCRSPRSAGTSMVYLGNTLVHRDRDPEAGRCWTRRSTPTVFISLPVAERLFQTQPNPSEIYVRANVNDVTQVSNLLAAHRRPPERERRPGQPPVGRARGARRRQGPVHDAAARPRRGRAARRRDRDRQHHGDLGARAPRRDRPAARARRHPPPHQHPVPGRVRAAGGARRGRRPGARRRRHRGLRGGARTSRSSCRCTR